MQSLHFRYRDQLVCHWIPPHKIVFMSGFGVLTWKIRCTLINMLLVTRHSWLQSNIKFTNNTVLYFLLITYPQSSNNKTTGRVPFHLEIYFWARGAIYHWVCRGYYILVHYMGFCVIPTITTPRTKYETEIVSIGYPPNSETYPSRNNSGLNIRPFCDGVHWIYVNIVRNTHRSSYAG